MSRQSLFRALDAWDPAPLRKFLHRGGFHHEALQSLGLPAHWLHSKIPRAALLGHAAEGSPVHTLIRLFTLGDTIDGTLALQVLGDAIHGLLEIGFLKAGNGGVSSLYQLFPIDGNWIACDFPARQGQDEPDTVMGIGPSSRLLASLAPPVTGRVLELACGIAWLSGKMSAAGANVVSTDINPRALDLALFAARLRGAPAPDIRLGDGYAPVAGETFDLIVANPPYVQSPDDRLIFREAGSRNPICARLLRDAPGYLADDGLAIMLINWTHQDDDDWRDDPLSWVAPEGVRRWLFQSDCHSPADYAWQWIAGDPRFQNESAAEAEIKRWLSYYQAGGVKRISSGFMVLQKCKPGGEWMRTESRAAKNISIQSGAELKRVVENQTWLASGPDLLNARFIVPDGINAVLDMDLVDSGWGRHTIRLTSPAKLSYDGQVDENILRLLAILREGRTAADMVGEILAKPGFVAIPDIPEKITGLVHELVSHGLLEVRK